MAVGNRMKGRKQRMKQRPERENGHIPRKVKERGKKAKRKEGGKEKEKTKTDGRSGRSGRKMKNSARAAALGTGTRGTGRFLRGRGKKKPRANKKATGKALLTPSSLSPPSLPPSLPPLLPLVTTIATLPHPPPPLQALSQQSLPHTHTHILPLLPSSLPLESFPIINCMCKRATDRDRQTNRDRPECVLRLNIRSEPNFHIQTLVLFLVRTHIVVAPRVGNPPSIVTCRQKQDQKRREEKNIFPNPIIHDVKKAWFDLI